MARIAYGLPSGWRQTGDTVTRCSGTRTPAQVGIDGEDHADRAQQHECEAAHQSFARVPGSAPSAASSGSLELCLRRGRPHSPVHFSLVHKDQLSGLGVESADELVDVGGASLWKLDFLTASRRNGTGAMVRARNAVPGSSTCRQPSFVGAVIVQGERGLCVLTSFQP
jgi:hypothetical protein